jgi:NAD-dependent SIR2 family protein deacetylase
MMEAMSGKTLKKETNAEKETKIIKKNFDKLHELANDDK